MLIYLPLGMHRNSKTWAKVTPHSFKEKEVLYNPIVWLLSISEGWRI